MRKPNPYAPGMLRNVRATHFPRRSINQDPNRFDRSSKPPKDVCAACYLENFDFIPLENGACPRCGTPKP